MGKELYYEDVQVGDEVTPLSKVATTAMLVRFGGAAEDYNPLHYDDSYAASRGISGGRIVYGALKRQWLVQMMVDWAGEPSALRKLSCYHLKMDYPRRMKSGSEPVDGETWWCKGKVTAKRQEDGVNCVECSIWVENGKGERTAVGNATMVLAGRA